MSYTLPLQELIDDTSSVSVSYATLSAVFGDGYEQNADDGINPRKAKWMITYSHLTETSAATISTFLDTVRGSSPFYGTPHGEVQQVWKLEPTSVQKIETGKSRTTQETIRSISFTVRSGTL